jgi:hypothetical protein
LKGVGAGIKEGRAPADKALKPAKTLKKKQGI